MKKLNRTYKRLSLLSLLSLKNLASIVFKPFASEKL